MTEDEPTRIAATREEQCDVVHTIMSGEEARLYALCLRNTSTVPTANSD